MAHVDTEQAWSFLLRDLGLLLQGLRRGQSLTLSVRGSSRLVRVRQGANDDLRVEAVGNGHLAPSDRLDLESLDLLEDLGWLAPTHFVDQGEAPRSGSTNHFVDVAPSASRPQLASVIIRTIRGVFEVASPDDLVWRSNQPLAADLAAVCSSVDVDVAAAAESVVDGVLSDLVSGISRLGRIDSLTVVEGTDRMVCIVGAGGTVTVLYDAVNALVRASVPVVAGFPTTAQALLALHDCARPMRCGRLELRGGTVFALVDLPAFGPVGELLVSYLESVSANLDGLRDALAPFTAVA